MRIELLDVHKCYGDISALRGVTLTVPSGQRVALVGPNGSGKSTLIRAIMGMLRIRGKIRLDGDEPGNVELARKIAYVPQNSPLLNATVEDLICFTELIRDLKANRVKEVAARLSLDTAAIARQPVRSLSGGMRQKLMLALAFAAPFSLLILDEPTASLDEEARNSFPELYGEVAADTTVLVSTHRLEEVRLLAEHVVMLEDGQVVYQGLADEVLRPGPAADQGERWRNPSEHRWLPAWAR